MQNIFPFTQAFTANQKGVNPIATWAGRFAPASPSGRVLMKLLVRSTTAGNVMTLNSGTRSIAPRSPIQTGGTAGQTPVEFSTTPIEWVAFSGEEIIPLMDEVLGGTPSVDGILLWTVL